MKKRTVHQKKENLSVCTYGCRTRKARGFGKEMVLEVPRTLDNDFYPVLLDVLRDEVEERLKLIFSLY